MEIGSKKYFGNEWNYSMNYLFLCFCYLFEPYFILLSYIGILAEQEIIIRRDFHFDSFLRELWRHPCKLENLNEAFENLTKP